MKVVANERKAQGTGASRRLRRAGKVPGVLYGGEDGKPLSIELDHNALFHAIKVESFHSSILDMEIDGTAQRVLLRDLQWHPYRQQIQHIDFQRVTAGQAITTYVPIHFVNEEVSPGVKLGAAVVTHVLNELQITCLPRYLPEFIELDLSTAEIGDVYHVSELPMPEGVKAILHGKEDAVVVTVALPAEEIEEEIAEVAEVEVTTGVAAKKGEPGEKSDKPEKSEKSDKK